MTGTVNDNPAQQRYEIYEDGDLAAFTEYRLHGEVADFVHTETLDGFEGRGLAGTLVQQALDDARRRGRQVRPYCEYVRGWIGKHPEYVDLVPATARAEFGLDG